LDLTKAFSKEFKPVPPYSFELTMRKPAGWWWSTPDEVYEAGICWTLTRYNGKLVGLKIWSTGTARKPRIQCVAYSKGAIDDVEKGGIEGMLRRALKIDEDLCGFYELAEKDSILRDVVEDLYGMRTVGWPELFPALILAVTLQMAPMKRSDQMMESLISRWGEKVIFEGKTMRYWPSTKTVAELSVEELMAKAKLGYRAKNLKAIAEALNAGFPSIDELSQIPPEEARKTILSLRGIGDYSAELVMPRMGFPLDVWSAKIFSVLFNGEKPGDPRETIPALKEIAEKRWDGWMGHAFVYVLNDLPKLSKRLGVDFTKF
jgi:DNA-3-methyladenine glycosylase II